MAMVDELLAKLEGGSISFDMAGGGVPQLTAADVAAALGMCEDKFAATIYQAVCGGYLHWPEVDRMLAAYQYEEWRARADRLITAQLAKAQAEHATEDRRRLRQHATHLMDGARAAMWPPLAEDKYKGIRRGVIEELRRPRVCPACFGRGSVKTDTLVIDCENCAGTGRTKVSDYNRAELSSIPHSSYSRTWKPVYEWLYFRLVDACCRGREQFCQALGKLAA